MRNRNINIRLTENELSLISKKAEKAKMTKTQFLVESCNQKQIVVFDGLTEVAKQLCYLNKNINQLTILAHKGYISTINLNDFKKRVDELWQYVCSLNENVPQHKA